MANFNPLRAKKKIKKSTRKQRKPKGSASRDFRGVDGVVDDATGTKHKVHNRRR